MTKDAGMGTSVESSIAPMLSVRHGARAVEFYKSAFGAIEVYRVEDPTGSVVSRLSVDGAEFWLSDESPEHGNFSPESLGGASARMILTMADPMQCSRRDWRQVRKRSSRWWKLMAGAWAASSIHPAITGRSAILWSRRSNVYHQ